MHSLICSVYISLENSWKIYTKLLTMMMILWEISLSEFFKADFCKQKSNENKNYTKAKWSYLHRMISHKSKYWLSLGSGILMIFIFYISLCFQKFLQQICVDNWKILIKTVKFCLCFTSFMIRIKLLMKAFLSYFLPIHLYLLLIFHIHPAFHFSMEQIHSHWR